MARIANDVKRRFRNRVLPARLQKGLKTQKELSERTGIRPSILCDIESNKIFLSSIYALRIADVLGCKLDELYEPIGVDRQ